MSEKTTYMPQKEFYALVAEQMADNYDVVAFCEHKLEQLSRPRPRKVNAEAVEFAAEVWDFVRELGEINNQVVREHFNVSSQKSAAALRRLVQEGKLVEIPSDKKSAPKQYKVAA